MAERIHIVLGREEKERYRMAAAREGRSLSEWLREAAKERYAASEERRGLETREDLKGFFSACDERESGREPDWEEHRRVIEGSKVQGLDLP